MAAQHDVDLLCLRLALSQQYLALVKEQQLTLPYNLQAQFSSEVLLASTESTERAVLHKGLLSY